MRRITNFFGLLFLIYFAYNSQSWHIGIRENNILSKIIVKPIQWIPNWMIIMLFTGMIIIYIIEIIRDKKEFNLHVISLTIITIVTKICFDILMLENISYFTLFYIEHPVPIELKLLHFKNTLALALESIPKEKIEQMSNVIGLKLNNSVISDNIASDIKDLNAQQIIVYTQGFLNKLESNYNNITSAYLTCFALGLGFCGIIAQTIFRVDVK